MKGVEDISILLTDKGFQKILSNWNRLSFAKKSEVLKEYKLTSKDIILLQQLWLGLDFKPKTHSSEKIKDILDETVWKIAERRIPTEKNNPVRKLYQQFSKIAAVLILPIIIYSAYIQFFKPDNIQLENVLSQLVTINSQSGTITNLNLPDGSKVWLNAGSSISYPNYFDGDKRKVSLKGEAYFEVVKDMKKPMIVSLGDVNIRVYGTSFNVNAFPMEKSLKVTLVEGSVSLSSTVGKFGGKDEFFITPGQTVDFSEDTKKLIVENRDPYLYTAWKDGLLIFRDVTFETVLTRLSRKFNIDIELKDQSMASIPMDATFKDENVDEILRLLSLGTPFIYKYGEPEKLPDGTFVRSKIYIEKK